MFTLIALLRARYHEYINSGSHSPIRIFFKFLNEFAPWHPIRLMKNLILFSLSLMFAIVYFVCSLLSRGVAALVLVGIRKILSLFSHNNSAENSDTIPSHDSEANEANIVIDENDIYDNEFDENEESNADAVNELNNCE